jgi:hypothetical protein
MHPPMLMAGFDPATVPCPGGTVCPNHPHALDAHLVGLPDSVRAPAHSHIITDREAAWHNAVNIRVTSLAVWNQIAQARSLAKVRELQATGLLGPDVPTNVYFFFEVRNADREQLASGRIPRGRCVHLQAQRLSFTCVTTMPGRMARVSGVRLTSRTSLPSAFMVYTPLVPSRELVNAMRLPSGDHRGRKS